MPRWTTMAWRICPLLLLELGVVTATFSLSASEALVKRHCSLCHATPAADFLAKEDWPTVMAWMGAYLGIDPPADMLDLPPVARAMVNTTSKATRADLEAITAWLQAAAPSRADRQAEVLAQLPQAAGANTQWRVDAPSELQSEAGVVTLLDVRADRIVLGTGLPAQLTVLQQTERSKLSLPSEPISLVERAGLTSLGLMGNLGTDRQEGAVWLLQEWQRQRELVKGRRRLAQHRLEDVDSDGRSDLVLVGFGDFPHGELVIRWDALADQPVEQVLSRESGVVSLVVQDMDGDGRRDLMVCFAQVDPRIELWRQVAPRQFERRVLLRRPVGWGYNGMELRAIDGDERLSLITIAGNNMELPHAPLKAVHAIRVFAIEGRGADLHLRLRCELPLPGATRTAWLDGDGDGDLDLVATALFPAWTAVDVPLTAVYGRRDGPDTFQWQRFTGLPVGRWLTPASGDADGDGVADILLGGAPSLPMPPSVFARFGKDFRAAPLVLRLRRRSVSPAATD